MLQLHSAGISKTSVSAGQGGKQLDGVGFAGLDGGCGCWLARVTYHVARAVLTESMRLLMAVRELSSRKELYCHYSNLRNIV